MKKREIDAAPPERGEGAARAMLEASLRGEVSLDEIGVSAGGDLAWQYAIVRWRAGSSVALGALLGGKEPIPDFARAFLADVAAGRAERKRGRKSDQEWGTLRDALDWLAAIAEIRKVYGRHLKLRQAQRVAERQARPGARGPSPSDEAIEDAAAELDMSVRQVSEVVHRRQRKRGAAPK